MSGEMFSTSVKPSELYGFLGHSASSDIYYSFPSIDRQKDAAEGTAVYITAIV